MNNLQELREKIIEAVPEIVELKFGCEIRGVELKFVTSPRPEEALPIEELSWDKEEEEFMTLQDFYIYKTEDKPGDVVHSVNLSYPALMIVEIIGRPITLADVLKAYTDLKVDGITALGKTEVPLIVAKWIWDKTPNDLDKKAEKTINLLHTILCK